MDGKKGGREGGREGGGVPAFGVGREIAGREGNLFIDRKSTRLNSSHVSFRY